MFYRGFGHGNASMQVQHAIFLCFHRIKSVEENQLHTEQKERKFVSHLTLCSVGIHQLNRGLDDSQNIIIAAELFYFLCFPASLQEELFYITPLLTFPIM